MKNAGVCDEAIDGVNSVEMYEDQEGRAPPAPAAKIRHEARGPLPGIHGAPSRASTGILNAAEPSLGTVIVVVDGVADRSQ